ncbi:MAG: fibronectin type III domain-containing protein [Myxococcota bacterium]
MGRERVRVALVFSLLWAGCSGLPPFLGRDLLESRIRPSFDRAADLLPPERLRVVSTANREIWLAWDPVLVGDVAGYVVTRAEQAAGPYETVGQTRSRFDTVFTDRGRRVGSLGDGRTYYYRVHPFDGEGRVSRSHGYLVATTDPPPPVPMGLHAFSNLPRRVVLEWDPSPDPSVTAYTIHRSPTVAGPWEQIARVSGRLRTLHEDRVDGDLRVMYYRVRAVNAFGGESGLSEPIRAVTKAEPLPPTGLKLAGRALGRVQLRWAPNVEPDLQGYEVWRAERNGRKWSEERLIAEVEPAAIALTDANVGCGARVRYRLRASDRDGLRSGFSEVLEATGVDVGLRARVRKTGAVELSWDPDRSKGWTATAVLLLRRWLPDRWLGTPAPDHAFTVPDLEPGRHRLTVLFEADGAPGTEPPVTDVQATELRCDAVVELP